MYEVVGASPRVGAVRVCGFERRVELDCSVVIMKTQRMKEVE